MSTQAFTIICLNTLKRGGRKRQCNTVVVGRHLSSRSIRKLYFLPNSTLLDSSDFEIFFGIFVLQYLYYEANLKYSSLHYHRNCPVKVKLCYNKAKGSQNCNSRTSSWEQNKYFFEIPVMVLENWNNKGCGSLSCPILLKTKFNKTNSLHCTAQPSRASVMAISMLNSGRRLFFRAPSDALYDCRILVRLLESSSTVHIRA